LLMVPGRVTRTPHVPIWGVTSTLPCDSLHSTVITEPVPFRSEIATTGLVPARRHSCTWVEQWAGNRPMVWVDDQLCGKRLGGRDDSIRTLISQPRVGARSHRPGPVLAGRRRDRLSRRAQASVALVRRGGAPPAVQFTRQVVRVLAIREAGQARIVRTDRYQRYTPAEPTGTYERSMSLLVQAR
jgi:hypothetical protein